MERSLSFYADEQEILDIEYAILEKKRKALNIVTLIFLGIYACSTIGVSSIACHRGTYIDLNGEVQADLSGYFYNAFVAVGIFTILGIILLVTGICMIFTLRRHFKRFYKDFKCYLLAATIFLSVPLFIRGVWDFLTFDSKLKINFGEWAENNYTVSNDVFNTVASFMPIVAQMCSLVFGVTRHSNDKKMAKMTQAMNEAAVLKDQ